MKKITITIAVIVGVLFFNSKEVNAQNREGQVVVDAGLGYSLIFAVPGILISDGSYSSHSATPAINATADYALLDRFSLGLGITYQSVTLNYADYYNNVTGAPETYSTSISRLNIGIRPLYHFASRKRIDLYIGARFGLSIWNNANANDPYNSGSSTYSGTLPSFQALFGVRKYFSHHVGAHVEFALGTPYFMEAGISVKFGGKNSLVLKYLFTFFHFLIYIFHFHDELIYFIICICAIGINECAFIAIVCFYQIQN
jgi:hypothetical protein